MRGFVIGHASSFDIVLRGQEREVYEKSLFPSSAGGGRFNDPAG
jgi:hypothetical protein